MCSSDLHDLWQRSCRSYALSVLLPSMTRDREAGTRAGSFLPDRVLHWAVFFLGVSTHLAVAFSELQYGLRFFLSHLPSFPLSFHSGRPASQPKSLSADSCSFPFIHHNDSPDKSLAHLVLTGHQLLGDQGGHNSPLPTVAGCCG